MPYYKMIALKKICKSFNGRAVINDLSLEIGSGEVVGLWGSNGCGKSTILGILAGIEKADKGEIRVIPELKIGFAPQNPREGLLPWLSVERNFGIIARLKSQFSENIKTSLMKAGYSKHPGPKSFPDELSGGYLQRLAIYGAGSAENHLALLDEPFSNQDSKWRTQIVDWIRERCAAGQTFVIAAHEPELLTVVSDRVLILGKASNGNPTEIRIDIDVRKFPEALRNPKITAAVNQLVSSSYEN